MLQTPTRPTRPFESPCKLPYACPKSLTAASFGAPKQVRATESHHWTPTMDIGPFATVSKPAGTAGCKPDRFITARPVSVSVSAVPPKPCAASAPPPSAGAAVASDCMAEACGLASNARILEYKPAAPASSRPIDLISEYNRPVCSSGQGSAGLGAQLRRRIPTAPERVLDAPGLIDDYYLNLLDWSVSNHVAVALDQCVYVWDAGAGSVLPLAETSGSNYISSVRWSNDGAYLSVGISDGNVELWDVEAQQKLRCMAGRTARVGVMSWDRHLVSSGARDGSIWNHDVRVANHKSAELTHHVGEVCGLQWRSDGAQLASGGNDNVVNVWDARSLRAPKVSKTNHCAAVKALSWCPWQLNTLASGGGTQDKFIHFWNTTTGARVNSIQASSQVTGLHWSQHSRELVSTHGYPDNHLTVWAYPSLNKIADISAHDSRILHSALSPDGQCLATGASDENLKFWRIFDAPPRSIASSRRSALESDDFKKSVTIR